MRIIRFVTSVCRFRPAASETFPFKGTRRFVDVNSNRVSNLDGPSVWYTDSLGQNGRTEPFPGSIRQWIAVRDNSSFDLSGGVIGRDRDYDARGVHAPN